MKTTLKSTLKALLTLTFILTLLLNGTAFAQSAFDQTAAENLALEAAGATRERALLFPTEIETEHGQTAYDVEFRCDGFEYEFDVFMDMDNDNTGLIAKTRCPALTNGVFKKPGADIANTTSALLQHGIGHITTLVEGMARWMEEHEYDSVDMMKGSLSQRNVAEPAAFERANYMKTLRSYSGLR